VHTVYIRTDDFQLAYHLIRRLQDEPHIRVRLLNTSEPPPPDHAVWLASPNEVQGEENGLAATIHTLDEVVSTMKHRLRSFKTAHQLVIGIDPGPRPGLAWYTDHVFDGTLQCESIPEAIGHILMLQSNILVDSMVIHVGNGSPTYRDRIINECLAYHLPVYEVDEKRTSSRHRGGHIASAMAIAKLRGQLIMNTRLVKPTDGEIRNVQKMSRRLSVGNVTIPAHLARLVILGTITIEDALCQSGYSSSDE